MTTAAVLGAGIQGVCAALALRQAGYRVVLIEQDPAPMLRASLRNEGKIHLGHVYANDPSFRTAQLMIDSALSFAPLLDRWTPSAIDWLGLRTRSFDYVIMRDSMVDIEDLLAHYERVDSAVLDHPGRANYLGVAIEPRSVSADVPDFLSSEVVQAVVHTSEVAIDLARFRAVLAAFVEDSEIDCRFDCRAEHVTRAGAGFIVEGRSRAGEPDEIRADIVVNCLWSGRLRIDHELGLDAERPWVHRLKYRVLAELPERLARIPALTLVLGSYGDVVPIEGQSSYVSWYPSCRRGWSTEPEAPLAWDLPCSGQVDTATADEVARATLEALDRVVPGIAAARITAVDAGVVFSSGTSDIDDHDSELHQRYATGVRRRGDYFSIDTGKYTCAPYFAARLMELL